MKYKTLLFDADMTLLDFKAAEYDGIIETMRSYGLEIDDEIIKIYSAANDAQWKLFEQGVFSKAELVVNRFKVFFEKMGYPFDPAEANSRYVANLANGHKLMPDALEVCKTLSKTHKLYIITNGVATTQAKRFAECGLKPYFEKCFVSEAIGVPKPHKEFFDYVEENIEGFDKTQALVIGDSLTSDIQGGINAGIDTCWFNPKGEKTDLDITYEIKSLKELYDIV